MLLYLLAIWKPPRWLFNRLLRGVKASAEEQRMLPRLTAVVRTTYLFKRGLYHLRFMDFSVLPGRPAYWMSRLGVVRFCQRRFTPHLPRPERRAKKRSEVGARIPLIDVSN
jgi:hypothetical protein